MARTPLNVSPTLDGFPHPRGDGPSVASLATRSERFSPPAWGWPASLSSSLDSGLVFPTRVGMARTRRQASSSHNRFPHPRGDGPSSSHSPDPYSRFSPPAWGWPAGCAGGCGCGSVFPTRVGMARWVAIALTWNTSFPHPRGDGPNLDAIDRIADRFSPPAWGWPG